VSSLLSRAARAGAYRRISTPELEALDDGVHTIVHDKTQGKYFSVPGSHVAALTGWNRYVPRISYRLSVVYCCSLALVAAGVSAVFFTQNELRIADLQPSAVWFVVGYTLVQVVIHECAHLAALKFFGRKADKVGFKMNFYVFPAFYVRMNQAHLLARGERVVVHSAGLFVNGVLVLIVSLVAFLIHSDLLRVANWVFCAGLMSNLTPLLNADGYKVLLTLLNDLEPKAYSKKSKIILALRLASLVVVVWYLCTLWQTVLPLITG
jgi:putative peptide zinc metalloprotease protein